MVRTILLMSWSLPRRPKKTSYLVSSNLASQWNLAIFFQGVVESSASKKGLTLAHIVAAHNRLDLLKAMDKIGARLDVISKPCQKHPRGQAALDVACLSGSKQIQEFLRGRHVPRQESNENHGSRSWWKPYKHARP